MFRTNRLAMARWAVQDLAPQVKAHGEYHPATPIAPSYWAWKMANIGLALIERVLPHPEAKELENVVDVWAGLLHQRKVLSVSWAPDAPWIPPVVRNFKAGDWLQELGYPTQPEGSR